MNKRRKKRMIYEWIQIFEQIHLKSMRLFRYYIYSEKLRCYLWRNLNCYMRLTINVEIRKKLQIFVKRDNWMTRVTLRIEYKARLNRNENIIKNNLMMGFPACKPESWKIYCSSLARKEAIITIYSEHSNIGNGAIRFDSEKCLKWHMYKKNWKSIEVYQKNWNP